MRKEEQVLTMAPSAEGAEDELDLFAEELPEQIQPKANSTIGTVSSYGTYGCVSSIGTLASGC
jgi:hypothetical protein